MENETHINNTMPEGSQDDKLSSVGLVLGIGGAGCNVVDMLEESPCPGLRCLAVDSDEQSLVRLKRCKSLQIGDEILHGFGAGSSRETAHTVAEAESENLRQLIQGHTVLFLIAGLGGGIGGEITSAIVRLAEKEKIFAIVLAIQPFDCEGSDRVMRAKLELNDITALTGMVISLPNQLLTTISTENMNFASLKNISNQMIVKAVRGIWLSFENPNFLALDAGVLRRVFSQTNSVPGSLAFASAEGPQKLEDLWTELIQHPWLKQGTVLQNAGRILVIFVAGSNFSHNDVEDFRRLLHEENPGAEIVLGFCSDPHAGWASVDLILITSPSRAVPPMLASSQNEYFQNNLDVLNEVDNETIQAKRPPTRRVALAPQVTKAQAEYIKAHVVRSGRKGKRYENPDQGILDLQITSVGRFDSCEKTFFNGLQLDVPTFIRLKYDLE